MARQEDEKVWVDETTDFDIYEITEFYTDGTSDSYFEYVSKEDDTLSFINNDPFHQLEHYARVGRFSQAVLDYRKGNNEYA